MKSRIAVAAGLLAIIGSLQAQAPADRPFIAVHGEAKMDVVPDIFPVELTLKETSTDAAATQQKIESLARDILAVTEKMKVKDDDVTISNLEISPEYKWDDDADKQVFQGNTYEREIKVRFHSLAKLNEFISALPKSNALRIQTAKFETSRADELRRELLDSAIANARKTAEVMATGVGRKLGAVQNISNQGLNLQYSQSLESVVVTGARATDLYAPAPPPPPAVLREGKITLDQDVYIVYELN
ncbi:SIMPL domain-containing protein [Pseudoxanthomonas sangjuensis]|uniref:SIMPL domain-containing protein n=1 Tax=Pseudoxanthomonas sangjuensis TaxID=1503750 RepID=UPI0013916E0C|nr:SIMPL domain-containing protein [Pseudoxanthomonas sangjuensis]